MSFLSKMLARRRDRRPPKRSAAHIPRGIATDLDDDVWNGPSLGPDVIPAIPRSPIDYAFNQKRNVWEPQPRPVSPILPIQADANRQQRLLDQQRQHRVRHQASTGDLERIVYFMSSPTASTFSSTSLPPLTQQDDKPLHRPGSRSREALSRWGSTTRRQQSPSRVDRSSSATPSPLSTLESFDVGTLPIEGPGGSLASPADGSSSAGGSDTSEEDERLPGRRYMRDAVARLPADQEEYFEPPPPPRELARQKSFQKIGSQQQQRGLADQVEYLSDGTDSDYDTEKDQHEPQGLEQFSRSSKQQQQPLQSPSMSTSTATTGPFLVDTMEEEEEDDDDDTDDELARLRQLQSQRYMQLQPRQQQQHTNHEINDYQVSDEDEYDDDDDYDDAAYEDDTVSELSSYSAAAAAFPLAAASSTIGIATTVNGKSAATAAAVADTGGETASTFSYQSTYQSTYQSQMDIRATALSPPPPARMSTAASHRLTDASRYNYNNDRASSNVVNLATLEADSSSRDGTFSRTDSNFSSGGGGGVADRHGDDRGRTSWVSSVSSYYGQPENAR
ncbi:uncharacterized protein B0I36DRAFT_338301 [Microdochium trichocladiopsis]|uniref:Uncharacterized protein n=1 Tax=Microdochium trichocladiopsis TaxID=1682393 RepID=A0A9P9BJ00_9PEZI|nr:uncharacterized protein B0I36DRAFT_338301 [Microdochium trichocladiopsis]KAH7014131.1 hypothetical protein B0I36DRAFT_338301 [Microdochium trichocladiopsis]